MSRVIDIGAAPANADCAQLGHTSDFARINALEVKLYGAAIRARFGNPPPGCELRSIANHHDFGTDRTLGLAIADEAEDCPEVGRYAADVIDGLASGSRPDLHRRSPIAATARPTPADAALTISSWARCA